MKKCIAQMIFDDWAKVELALDWCSCNNGSSLYPAILKRFIAPARASSDYIRDTLLPTIPNLHAWATRNNALNAVLPGIRLIVSEWSVRVLGVLPATTRALETDLATLEEKWDCNCRACGILQDALLGPSLEPTFDVGVPRIREYHFMRNLKTLCTRLVQGRSHIELPDLSARFYTVCTINFLAHRRSCLPSSVY